MLTGRRGLVIMAVLGVAAVALAYTGHGSAAQGVTTVLVLVYTWPQIEPMRAQVRRWLGPGPPLFETRPRGGPPPAEGGAPTAH